MNQSRHGGQFLVNTLFVSLLQLTLITLHYLRWFIIIKILNNISLDYLCRICVVLRTAFYRRFWRCLASFRVTITGNFLEAILMIIVSVFELKLYTKEIWTRHLLRKIASIVLITSTSTVCLLPTVSKEIVQPGDAKHRGSFTCHFRPEQRTVQFILSAGQPINISLWTHFQNLLSWLD